MLSRNVSLGRNLLTLVITVLFLRRVTYCRTGRRPVDITVSKLPSLLAITYYKTCPANLEIDPLIPQRNGTTHIEITMLAYRKYR